MASGSGSPCGACKFLRRKCASDCIFAPYFCFDQAHSQFAAIHKIFGASNVSKLLLHVPASDRCEAVVTIAYEAQARLRDPVYGCVAHIFALQQQVAILQAQLMQVKAQIAHNIAGSRPSYRDQWQADAGSNPSVHSCSSAQPVQLKRSVDCMEYYSQMQEEMDYEDGCTTRHFAKRRAPHELGELQAMALRMMRS